MSANNERNPHLIRAAEVKSAEGEFSHPWNPKSRLIGTHLSKAAGLQRAGVSIVRIPAGHESFAYHAHHREEEWVYILSGRGMADVDDKQYEVAAGDFLGFPTSVAHHMRNPFDEDLVYLMGGENLDTEIADFPRLGKRMVRMGDEVAIYSLADGKPLGPLD
ncbi:cupin domain-containing protein [Massilia agilis]|uniref:Cupin domain-containing protein n=1 Tax=Massilia agilis TaxID=1811226 RepID=A0ABT2D9K5_9BURK|nr:cupin domain-containing protein [Massilia agilis]MCS0807529.1 cupin domain-containing protein [Massilia agilis]